MKKEGKQIQLIWTTKTHNKMEIKEPNFLIKSSYPTRQTALMALPHLAMKRLHWKLEYKSIEYEISECQTNAIC